MDPTTPADTRRTAGVVLCLVSACGFGLMAIFAKEAYAAGLGVTALLAARFVVAAGVLWAIVGVRRRRRRHRAAPGQTPPRPGRRVVLAGLGLGAIGYAAQAGLFFSALRHIDASLTSLLLYTYPALVFCGAVALGREHVTPRKALALSLASAGAGLVLLGGGTRGLEATGVAMALGAGAAYAVYILVADGVVARIDAFELGALVATGAAVTFAARRRGQRRADLHERWLDLDRRDRARLDGAADRDVHARHGARRRLDGVDRVNGGAGRHGRAGRGAVRREPRSAAGARRRARACRGGGLAGAGRAGGRAGGGAGAARA